MSAQPTFDDLEQAEPVPLAGRVIAGRYRLGRELARGGIGAIFEGEHLELERPVAIKLLVGDLSRHADVVERFLREAKTASRIGHPSIVEVYDLGRDADGIPFLVMELLEGEDLDSLLEREKRVDGERLIELLTPVASALDAVHSEGVVHRDIKPANIFLSRRSDGSEHIKLLDFGLAAFHERGDRLTQVGNVVGTPHYMPPEAAEGDLMGPRGDVYSLAVVAYELLTGVLPFDAETATGVLVKKVAHPAPSLAERTGEDYPEAVEAVFARALSRTPGVRPATCGELMAELRAVFESPAGPRAMPVSASRGSDERPPPKLDESAGASSAPPTSPVSRLWVAVGILALVGASIGLWSLFGASASTTADREANTVAAAGPLDPAVEGPIDPPALDPVDTEAADPEPPAAEPTEAVGEASPRIDTPARSEERAPRSERAVRPSSQGSAPAEAAPPTPAEAAPPTPAEAAPPTPAEAAPPTPADEGAARPISERSGDRRARATEFESQARAALISGQLPRALELYREATRADPRHAASWRGLGLVNERMSRGPEAVRAYETYLRLAPNASDAAAVRQRADRLR